MTNTFKLCTRALAVTMVSAIVMSLATSGAEAKGKGAGARAAMQMQAAKAKAMQARHSQMAQARHAQMAQARRAQAAQAGMATAMVTAATLQATDAGECSPYLAKWMMTKSIAAKMAYEACMED